MRIDNKIRDEELKSDNNKKAVEILALYHNVKLINMNILQVKKYYLPIKV